MVLLLADEFARLRAAPVGALLVLGAAFTWAIGTVLQKKYPISAPLPALTAWLMLVGGIPVYVGAAFVDFGKAFDYGLAPSLALAYNVFIAFAWGYWAWIKLVGAVSVTVFSLCMLMTPVVGVFSGMLLLGERPTWAEYGALVLVMGALLTVIKPGAKT
jgi:drug/metabolite transporter (DMT)-like permease